RKDRGHRAAAAGGEKQERERTHGPLLLDRDEGRIHDCLLLKNSKVAESFEADYDRAQCWSSSRPAPLSQAALCCRRPIPPCWRSAKTRSARSRSSTLTASAG